MDNVVNVNEAAKACALPPRTIRYMCSKGEWKDKTFQVENKGRMEWRIPDALIRAYQQEHPQFIIVEQAKDETPSPVPPSTPTIVENTPPPLPLEILQTLIHNEVVTALEEHDKKMSEWLEKRFGKPAAKRWWLLERMRRMVGKNH